MDEYDPDKKQQTGSSSKEPIRVPIDDRTPLSIDHPKYAEKYAKHVEMGVAMYLCPICHQLGCHKVTSIDQVGSSRSAGEACDVCGYEDTYEMGA